jgi:hypothetical protein
MSHLTASTARVLQAQIDAEYRDTVMLRGLAEAELASAAAKGEQRQIDLQRHAVRLVLEQVRILEDARRDVAALIRTLEAL